ncbi:hypothetical protein DUNSADRAFT_1547 [Dunaliella salina]|uniref:Encoded protein n=1 Tax=Dunaliella salina TaxID=3046 RepID=A0ABQ7FXB7_DUNSA|nr:hypothetical protein DUNSADRAFT_1547 [Dunaliella salina]|eukprot:KAF5826998.1 hypothetical protein DUNSADRAFT_1547 [Dunaliella salina]
MPLCRGLVGSGSNARPCRRPGSDACWGCCCLEHALQSQSIEQTNVLRERAIENMFPARMLAPRPSQVSSPPSSLQNNQHNLELSWLRELEANYAGAGPTHAGAAHPSGALSSWSLPSRTSRSVMSMPYTAGSSSRMSSQYSTAVDDDEDPWRTMCASGYYGEEPRSARSHQAAYDRWFRDN